MGNGLGSFIFRSIDMKFDMEVILIHMPRRFLIFGFHAQQRKSRFGLLLYNVESMLKRSLIELKLYYLTQYQTTLPNIKLPHPISNYPTQYQTTPTQYQTTPTHYQTSPTQYQTTPTQYQFFIFQISNYST